MNFVVPLLFLRVGRITQVSDIKLPHSHWKPFYQGEVLTGFLLAVSAKVDGDATPVVGEDFFIGGRNEYAEQYEAEQEQERVPEAPSEEAAGLLVVVVIRDEVGPTFEPRR